MAEDTKDGAAATPLSPSSPGPDGNSTAQCNYGVETDDTQSRSHASSIVGEGDEKHVDEESQQPPRQSTDLGPAIVVPRMKRRGLFSQLTLVAEVEDPKTYTRRMKWFITFIVAVAAVAAPSGSAIFFRESIVPCSIVLGKLMESSNSLAFSGIQGVRHHFDHH